MWKGLGEGAPVFLSFDQVERMVSALATPIAAWRPEAVAGLARGGLIPAAMLACELGLELHPIVTAGRHGAASWLGSPPGARRILVVDDSCSTGRTLAAGRALAAASGAAVATAVIVYDPEVAAVAPEFGHAMTALFRLPWERGEATPASRAARRAGVVSRANELPFVALDGELRCLPPGFAPERAVVLSGRPEAERALVLAQWAEKGLGGLPLECRPETCGPSLAEIAAYKAETATRWGCTHVVESDPEQAIRIAALAPHLVVGWWSAADGRQWIVGSAASP